MIRGLLLCALALAAGCALVPPPPVPDYHVRIETVTGWGSGALVDSTTVLTVGHVVSGLDPFFPVWVLRGRQRRRAYVSEETRGHTGTIEPVVRLKLRRPLEVGEVALRPLRPGDSGTPIVGKGGAIVGLISGWGTHTKWLGRRGHTLIGTPVDPVVDRGEE